MPKNAKPEQIQLNAIELKLFLKWSRKHAKTCSKRNMCIKLVCSSGGGIGPATEVFCDCGEKEDITDYSCW